MNDVYPLDRDSLTHEFAQALEARAEAALADPKLPHHLQAYYRANLREARRLLNQPSESQSFTVRL